MHSRATVQNGHIGRCSGYTSRCGLDLQVQERCVAALAPAECTGTLRGHSRDGSRSLDPVWTSESGRLPQ